MLSGHFMVKTTLTTVVLGSEADLVNSSTLKLA